MLRKRIPKRALVGPPYSPNIVGRYCGYSRQKVGSSGHVGAGNYTPCAAVPMLYERGAIVLIPHGPYIVGRYYCYGAQLVCCAGHVGAGNYTPCAAVPMLYQRLRRAAGIVRSHGPYIV